MKFNKSFFKKFFLITGGLLVALIAIFAVIYTVLNIKWGGELRSELERLKAVGEPMTVKEITPAPLPAQENACIEYQQIFSIMTDGTFSMRGGGGSVDENKDMKELNELCLSSKKTSELEERCKQNSDRIREILDKDSFKQVYDLCKQAAAKPGMNFNPNYLSYEEGPGLLLPHIGRMRSLARLLRLKAEMEILAGERDKAWETILTGLKISSHLKTEPFLISQLVYYACTTINLDFILFNLPCYGISDESAGKLMAELSPGRTEYLLSMKKALDAERICLGGWVFERFLSRKKALDADNYFCSEFYGMISSESGSSIATSLLFISFAKPFLKKDYFEYLKIMEAYKNGYNQPYYKLTASSYDEKILGSLPSYCILTKLLCPALGEIRLKTAEIVTRSQEICFRLALEEYKNLNGSYPEKIDDLSPQFLTEIPVSDMTGRPFEYSKDNDGYKISGGIAEKK